MSSKKDTTSKKDTSKKDTTSESKQSNGGRLGNLVTSLNEPRHKWTKIEPSIGSTPAALFVYYKDNAEDKYAHFKKYTVWKSEKDKVIVVEDGELPSRLTELTRVHLYNCKPNNREAFYRLAKLYNFFTAGKESQQYEERKKMWKECEWMWDAIKKWEDPPRRRRKC